ncbi:hypothetical protein [Nostoc sp.]
MKLSIALEKSYTAFFTALLYETLRERQGSVTTAGLTLSLRRRASHLAVVYRRAIAPTLK